MRRRIFGLRRRRRRRCRAWCWCDCVLLVRLFACNDDIGHFRGRRRWTIARGVGRFCLSFRDSLLSVTNVSQHPPVLVQVNPVEAASHHATVVAPRFRWRSPFA